MNSVSIDVMKGNILRSIANFLFPKEIKGASLYSLAVKFIFIFVYDRPKSDPSFFPYSKGKNYFQKSINYDGVDGEWYSRAYSDWRSRYYLLTEDSVERITAEIYKAREEIGDIEINVMSEMVIPLSPIGRNSEISVNITSEDHDLNFSYDMPGRFHYLNVPSNSTVNISSNGSFCLGDGIKLRQQNSVKKKMVLLLFIDGLVDREILGMKNLHDLMPNTYKYFRGGVDFRNHFANAEWTLASVPSFFTGCYTQKHGLFHPNSSRCISNKVNTLSELFSKEGYMTFQCGGNWRMAPPYGYTRGYDRTIYRNSMAAGEVIMNFMENQRAFRNRSQFAFLTFFDLHHDLHINTDISVSTSSKLIKPSVVSNTKSVFSNKDENKKLLYIEKIKKLDDTLGVLFDYISKLYSDDDVTVTLVSDHGQSYLSNENHPLSNSRIKIPWLIKDVRRESMLECEEFTENVDVFSFLAHEACSISTLSLNDSILPKILGGDVGRKFAFSQSLFPGQTYKAAFRSDSSSLYIESLSYVDSNGRVELPTNQNCRVFTEHGDVDDDIPEEYLSFLRKIWY